MIIKKTKYVIATKEFPLAFDSEGSDGEDTADLEDAYFYDGREVAEKDLDRFDEPETRQVLPVIITYEI